MDLEFHSEHGSPVTYLIQHNENSNHPCNNFFPIPCQQGNNNKDFWLHNDGENFTLNNLTNQCLFTNDTIRNRLFPTGQNNQSIPTLMPTLNAILEQSRQLWPYIHLH